MSEPAWSSAIITVETREIDSSTNRLTNYLTETSPAASSTSVACTIVSVTK